MNTKFTPNLRCATRSHGCAARTVKIVLRPGGVLKGRIVDKTGLPLEGAEIVNANAVMASPMAVRPVDDPTRGVLATRFDASSSVLRTGADGRFELRGIIPGLKYSAAAFWNTDDRPDHSGNLFTDVIVKPGEVKDLGDLVPNRDAINPPAGLAPAAKIADPEVEADALPVPEPKAIPGNNEQPEPAKSRAAKSGQTTPPLGPPVDGGKVKTAPGESTVTSPQFGDS